jgi:hypothetical protein
MSPFRSTVGLALALALAVAGCAEADGLDDAPFTSSEIAALSVAEAEAPPIDDPSIVVCVAVWSCSAGGFTLGEWDEEGWTRLGDPTGFVKDCLRRGGRVSVPARSCLHRADLQQPLPEF